MEMYDEKAACPLSLSFCGFWSFGALLESGISLIQFIVKNEHKDLFSPLNHSASKHQQTSADFLRPGFHTPTAHPVASRAISAHAQSFLAATAMQKGVMLLPLL